MSIARHVVQYIFTYMSRSLICPGLQFTTDYSFSLICPGFGAAKPPGNFIYMSRFHGGGEAARDFFEETDTNAREARAFFSTRNKNDDFHLYVPLTYMSRFPGKTTAFTYMSRDI